MELAIITAKQVVILYCLILVGFAGVKSGVIKPGTYIEKLSPTVMYLPDEREGASDPAVCLHIFQCGIYGVPVD